MKTGRLTCACLGALLLPLACPAQTPTERPLIGGHGDNVEAFIAQHDLNGDGTITWAEFEAFRRDRFNSTDSNHDGTVSEAEYAREFDVRLHEQLDQERAARIKQARARFAALDTHQDGKVTRAEFDAAGAKIWDSGQRALADRNKAAQSDPSGDAETAEATARSDNVGSYLLMPSSHSAEGFLALYDRNGDGNVDRAEFDRVRDAQFARTDRNHDGLLSEDEYLAEYEHRLDQRTANLIQAEDRQVRVRFRVLDVNRDGRMTFAEYQASGKRLFDTADRNHDGVVNAADAKRPLSSDQ